jgi:uncharacterized protein (TIGR03067 family)
MTEGGGAKLEVVMGACCSWFAAVGLLFGGPGPREGGGMKDDAQKLQGTWQFVSLEVEGAKMPAAALAGSEITIRGDTFVTTSPGAVDKGTFTLDTGKKPRTIDFTFTEGPEKGMTTWGIYELDGDTLRVCLSLRGRDRPIGFATKVGSGHALETLKRGAAAKPAPAEKPDAAPAKGSGPLSPELEKFQGEWSMVSGEMNGQQLPAEFVKTAKRLTRGDETAVSFGGQVFLTARVSVDPARTPQTIDYQVTAGPNAGKTQLGIYEWAGDALKVCYAEPGKDRPTDFTTPPGSGRVSSVWKREKK